MTGRVTRRRYVVLVIIVDMADMLTLKCDPSVPTVKFTRGYGVLACKRAFAVVNELIECTRQVTDFEIPTTSSWLDGETIMKIVPIPVVIVAQKVIFVFHSFVFFFFLMLWTPICLRFGRIGLVCPAV